MRMRKTDRPYVYITTEDIAQIREWFAARTKLGNQKVFAARIGVPIGRVQAVVRKIRNGG